MRPVPVQDDMLQHKGLVSHAERSLKDVALENELLCKILCHNIAVLIHEMREVNLPVVF